MPNKQVSVSGTVSRFASPHPPASTCQGCTPGPLLRPFLVVVQPAASHPLRLHLSTMALSWTHTTLTPRHSHAFRHGHGSPLGVAKRIRLADAYTGLCSDLRP